MEVMQEEFEKQQTLHGKQLHGQQVHKQKQQFEELPELLKFAPQSSSQ